jgi:ABC-type lipoprotein release transport system permease subunit
MTDRLLATHLLAAPLEGARDHAEALATLLFSLFMGLVGGFLPNVRAARLEIVDALRAA